MLCRPMQSTLDPTSLGNHQHTHLQVSQECGYSDCNVILCNYPGICSKSNWRPSLRGFLYRSGYRDAEATLPTQLDDGDGGNPQFLQSPELFIQPPQVTSVSPTHMWSMNSNESPLVDMNGNVRIQMTQITSPNQLGSTLPRRKGGRRWEGIGGEMYAIPMQMVLHCRQYVP